MSVAEPALLRVLHSQVRKMIQATCGDEYSEKYLERVEEWACVELLPWLDDLFRSSANSMSTLKWREILSQHVLQVLSTRSFVLCLAAADGCTILC